MSSELLLNSQNLSVADLISHFKQRGGRDNFFCLQGTSFHLAALIQKQEKEM